MFNDTSNTVRLSEYFLPTLRETPQEAQIVSHRYMLRAGMIRQASAGIYSWLPLGLIVLKKIENIVREEQNLSGAHEVLMPTIQSADLWRQSGRYEDYGKEMLRIRDRHDREMLYGPTNEELITEIFSTSVKSYRDLPLNLYHIQWKFRDEVRPRFGVMRGREFYMKDAYSFDLDAESGRIAYNKMFVTYLRTFARLGLKAIPMQADTGPIGGDMSHEFIVLADTGESDVFCHQDLLDYEILNENIDFSSKEVIESLVNRWTSKYAATDEMHNPVRFELEVPKTKRVNARGIEVGHIFHFGDKYSKPLNAYVNNKDGQEVAVQMGSYGVGVSRLVGGVIEASHDDIGIIWPESAAPFKVALINLRVDDEACNKACDNTFEKLGRSGTDVLYDDRNERAGVKFSEMDLIGLPWQLVIGPRGLRSGLVELKNRKNGERKEMSLDAAINCIIG